MRTVIRENIKIAFVAIRSHLLQTIITILIIAIGITALVGILTATDSIKYFLTSNFMEMGANTFSIKNRSLRIHFGRGAKMKYYKRITLAEATEFKDRFDFPSYTSIYTFASFLSSLKYQNEKTNPNVGVIGGDENYLITSGNEIKEGRNFTSQEVYHGDHVAIIGKEIVDKLFKKNEDPLGKIISIGAGKYKVIGVLKEKGTALDFTGDRTCILPLNNVRHYFPETSNTFTINVMITDPKLLDAAVGEATGLMRIIRKVPIGDDINFDVEKSDSISKMLIDNLQYVSLAATIIAMITLLGAVIGLMNIMLVSVTERTREVGIRKAIGANKMIIRNQFLTEAVVIGQLGGILGIILGILAGNIISYAIGSSFIVPWVWIITAIIICFFVGILSGIYPAMKAANVDPIESLRYE